MTEVKYCPGGCRQTLPLSEFHRNKNSPDGRTRVCKKCNVAGVMRYYRKKGRDRVRLRQYGITRAEYDRLLRSQGGVCAICRCTPESTPRGLHVDHCHQTRTVKGLLCGRCNRAIGLLREDAAIAERAAHYLRVAGMLRLLKKLA